MTPLTFKKVRAASQSDAGAIKVELFRNEDGRICAWFLGPIRLNETGVSIPYLPRSKNMVASAAVVRAVEEAKSAERPVCIIDPDDLWELVWQG